VRAAIVVLGALGCGSGPIVASWPSHEADSASPPPQLVQAPSSARADLLLLTLTPEGVVVDDVVGAVQWVDIDRQDGADEGFRTRVLAADGTELYRRNTPTPVLVRDFLAHYSTVAGLDLLTVIPDLGAFHVRVPRLDGAARVVFEIRQSDGSYDAVGEWDPADFEPDTDPPPEQVTGYTTLHWSGDSRERLDITLVGDGYTADQLDEWHGHAAGMADRLLSTPPLDAFADRINIHRIDTVSVEEGASFDCTDECRARDTAFRSVFAVNMINSMSGSGYRSTTLFQLEQHRLDRALAVVPTDLSLVVVNSAAYGGMSVHHATVSTPGRGWTETGVHELGHLLGLLGDEYTVDDCIRSDSMGLPRNIAASPTDLPWSHFVSRSTPVPTAESSVYSDRVGAFESAYNCPELFRPTELCKMKDSDGADFCPVCSEELVLQIARHTDLSVASISETAHGTRIDLDTLGHSRTVRRSADGTDWELVHLPFYAHPDDGDFSLEVTVHEPHVRDPDRPVVEVLDFVWE